MPDWAIPLCCGALTAAASPVEPVVTWSTRRGGSDCDDSALWRRDLFLACHSPESRLPVQVGAERSER